MIEEPESAPPSAGDDAASYEVRFVRLGLVFYGVLAATAIIWRTGLAGESILFVASTPGEVNWFRDAAAGAAVAGVLILSSDWMTRKTDWGDALARNMAEVLGHLSTPNAVLLAFASGFAEELFFRGALQPQVGLVLASLLFGCVHFVPQRAFLPWTGFAVVAGFLFGGLFVWTGNLVAPVVAHTLVNAVNLPLLVRRYPGGQDGGGATPGVSDESRDRDPPL